MQNERERKHQGDGQKHNPDQQSGQQQQGGQKQDRSQQGNQQGGGQGQREHQQQQSGPGQNRQQGHDQERDQPGRNRNDQETRPGARQGDGALARPHFTKEHAPPENGPPCAGLSFPGLVDRARLVRAGAIHPVALGGELKPPSAGSRFIFVRAGRRIL